PLEIPACLRWQCTLQADWSRRRLQTARRHAPRFRPKPRRSPDGKAARHRPHAWGCAAIRSALDEASCSCWTWFAYAAVGLEFTQHSARMYLYPATLYKGRVLGPTMVRWYQRRRLLQQ